MQWLSDAASSAASGVGGLFQRAKNAVVGAPAEPAVSSSQPAGVAVGAPQGSGPYNGQAAGRRRKSKGKNKKRATKKNRRSRSRSR